MTNADPHIEALYARAKAIKAPIFRLCRDAGVNKSTVSGWRAGVPYKSSTMARFVAALEKREREYATA